MNDLFPVKKSYYEMCSLKYFLLSVTVSKMLKCEVPSNVSTEIQTVILVIISNSLFALACDCSVGVINLKLSERTEKFKTFLETV